MPSSDIVLFDQRNVHHLEVFTICRAECSSRNVARVGSPELPIPFQSALYAPSPVADRTAFFSAATSDSVAAVMTPTAPFVKSATLPSSESSSQCSHGGQRWGGPRRRTPTYLRNTRPHGGYHGIVPNQNQEGYQPTGFRLPRYVGPTPNSPNLPSDGAPLSPTPGLNGGIYRQDSLLLEKPAGCGPVPWLISSPV